MGLDIALLGGLAVTRDGVPVELRAPKQRALLALLALEDGASVPAERLIDALWGATPPRTVAKNLQVLVGRLRTSLADDRAALASTPDGYRIDPDRCSIDIRGFEELVDRGRRAFDAGNLVAASDDLRTALALWRGDSLGSIELEEWALPHVARLRDLRTSALEHALHAELHLGRHDAILAELEHAVLANPHRERLRAIHMHALYRAGRQTDALDSFHAARMALDELGLEPGPELRELQRRILAQDPELDAVELDAGAVSQLVGRDDVIDALVARFVDDARLVTLTGAGGIGKTSVATVVVDRLAPDYELVASVELASARSAGQVAELITQALGLGSIDGDGYAACAQVIGSSRALLLLDNFEHVLEATDGVDSLLRSCAGLQVLVTSRARLGSDREEEVEVGALDVESARRLFMRRARGAGASDIVLEDVDAIDRICQRLDRLPLAIELAAARSSLLTPVQIEERIDRHLVLLRDRSAAPDDRQRSLQATIEWSHELLDSDARRVFSRFGLFPGGCPVDLLTAADGGDDVDVLDSLELLVRHRLVQRVAAADGSVRLQQLETIAAFAVECLAESSDRDDAHRRCADALHQLALASDSPTAAALTRDAVRAELPTIRLVLDWCCDRDPERAGALLAALTNFSLKEGWFSAVDHHLAALDLEQVASIATRARVSFLHGMVNLHRGQIDEAESKLEHARQLSAEIGDLPLVAWACNGLGECNLIREQFDHAEQHFLEVRALAESCGDLWLRALGTNNLGVIAFDRDEDGEVAGRFFAAANFGFREVGDEYWSIATEMNLASIPFLEGDIQTTLDAYLDIAERHDARAHRATAAQARSNALRMCLEVRDFERATEMGEAALTAAQLTGDRLLLAHTLSLLAIARALVGDERGRATALDAVALAIDTGRVRYLMYSTAAAALAEHARGNDEARDQWLGAFNLDRFTPSVLDQEVVASVRALGSRIEIAELGDELEVARARQALLRSGRQVASTAARPRS